MTELTTPATKRRATFQWRTTYARVIGGSRLPIPQNRLVPKARLTSQTSPTRVNSTPPKINNASIHNP